MRYLVPFATLLLVFTTVIGAVYMFSAIDRMGSNASNRVSIAIDITTDSGTYAKGSTGTATAIIYASRELEGAEIVLTAFNETETKRADLNLGMNTFYFSFEVPEDVKAGKYPIKLEVFWNGIKRVKGTYVEVLE